MTDKQYMEQLAAEVEKLPIEERYALLGTARGMGLMRKAQPEESAKDDENDEPQSVK